MHKFVLGFFNFLRSFFHFMKIVFVFCIIMLAFYWVQNLIHAEWSWLGFIKPFLDVLLEIANKIYSISFNLFGAVFELKYLSALIILIGLIFAMNLLVFGTNILEGIYSSARFVCKKAEEAAMNKALQNSVTKQEMKINKYSVVIHTEIKKKFSHQELNINLEEQNRIMNKFLMEKTCVQPSILDGGFMYKFTDFDKIDTVLEILFKILNSNSPLNYSICIQAGDDLEQLKKLVSLKHFGKISMAADTAYRYKFNETHQFQTSQIGLFQCGEKTLEVHEFKEIL